MTAIFLYFGIFLTGAFVFVAGGMILSLLSRGIYIRTVAELRPRYGVDRRWIAVGSGLLLAVAAALAALVFARPVFGLLAVGLWPSATRLAIRVGEARERRRVEASALAFLRALQGLVATGLSLPAALFHLSGALSMPFARELREALDRYDEGRSLSECLARFRSRSGVGRSATCLALLEMGYRQGLSVLPLLDAVLPRLESEAHNEARVRSLRQGAVAQIIIALALPWCLAATLCAFQPELEGRIVSSPVSAAVAGAALAWELLGAWILWRISDF